MVVEVRNMEKEEQMRLAKKLADKALDCLIETMNEAISAVKDTGDPEEAISLLHEWNSRVFHSYASIFRRTIEALYAAEVIKANLDKGEPKHSVYASVAAAMANSMSREDFDITMTKIQEILTEFYGIDDFIPVLVKIAQKGLLEQNRDVI